MQISRSRAARTCGLVGLMVAGATLSSCGGSTRDSAPIIGVGSCLSSSQFVEVVSCDSAEAAMRVTQEADVDPNLFASVDTLPPGESIYECPEGQDVIEINNRDFTNPANNSYEGTWCVALLDGEG